MSMGRTFEFGFDEQHDDLTEIPQRSCPECASPLKATRLETVCLDCGLVVVSERVILILYREPECTVVVDELPESGGGVVWTPREMHIFEATGARTAWFLLWFSLAGFEVFLRGLRISSNRYQPCYWTRST